MTNESGPWQGVDKVAIEQEIRAIEAQWKADLDARDVDALLSHSASDGATNLMNPGSGSTTYDESRKAHEKALEDPNFDSTFTTEYFGIADSGELAYCRGKYENWGSDPATGNKVLTSRGEYINVWKRDASGKWLAIEDFLAPFTTTDPGATVTG
jgi:ketosteroid isomerase-like protein